MPFSRELKVRWHVARHGRGMEGRARRCRGSRPADGRVGRARPRL